MNPITLKPVLSGKRSFLQALRGTQLLRNPATDIETLPQEVGRYLKGDSAGRLSEVAQWSVDNEEPKLLRALYDGGFRGPVSLKRVGSEHILPALLELNRLPLSPLKLLLDFDTGITSAQAACLAQLLRSQNLCILRLRLDLSSELTQHEVTELMSAVGFMYELAELDVLVDGRQQAPIAEHLIPPLLACRRALVLCGKALLSMVMKNWQDFQSGGDASLELKSLVDAIVSQGRAPGGPSQRDQGFLLFRRALGYGEFHLLRAMASLGLAPPPEGQLELVSYFPEGEALQALEQWPLTFSLKAFPQTSEAVDAIGRWLMQRPCLNRMTLSLNGFVHEAHLRRMADGVLGLRSPFKTLSLAVGHGVAIGASPEALSAPTQAGQLACLRLELVEVGSLQKAAYSAAVARLVQVIKPQRLEVAAPLTSVALDFFEACGEGCHFAPIELMHIQIARTDRSGEQTLVALQRFFKQAHQVARFIFDGAEYQWNKADKQQVPDLASGPNWLIEITLSFLSFKQQREVWWRGVSNDPARWRFWTFKPGRSDVNAAAESFFGLHLNGHVSAELGRKIITAGPLSPSDLRALSQVSSQTYGVAQLKARRDTLAQLVLDEQLNCKALHLLLCEPTTGQRDQQLAQSLYTLIKEQLTRARSGDSPSLVSALVAGERLLLEEQVLSTRQEHSTRDALAPERQ